MFEPACGASRIVAGGDFNSHNQRWRSINNSTSGKELFRLSAKYGLDILSSKHPTIHDPIGYLDFFVCDGVSPLTNYNELQTMDAPSDHDAVLLKCILDKPFATTNPLPIPDWRCY